MVKTANKIKTQMQEQMDYASDALRNRDLVNAKEHLNIVRGMIMCLSATDVDKDIDTEFGRLWKVYHQMKKD